MSGIVNKDNITFSDLLAQLIQSTTDISIIAIDQKLPFKAKSRDRLIKQSCIVSRISKWRHVLVVVISNK